MMKKHDIIQWSCLPLLLLFLVACGEKKEKPAPGTPAKTQAKKVETAKVASEVAEKTEELPLKYIYPTEGRRDPFQPFLLIRRPVDGDADLMAQTPLQQYETMQYKLSAVIVGYGQPMAMVVAPSGKSFVVRKGMKIGKSGGTVVQINKETILVEEKYRDLTNEIRTNMLEIKLPKREGV